MPLTMDSPGNINVVRSYGAGFVQVGEQRFTRCCVIGAHALVDDWRPQALAEIEDFDLAALLALDPELVIFGTAASPGFPPRSVRRWLAEKNIGGETMELGAACRTYNVLAQEGRRVIAVLFPG